MSSSTGAEPKTPLRNQLEAHGLGLLVLPPRPGLSRPPARAPDCGRTSGPCRRASACRTSVRPWSCRSRRSRPRRRAWRGWPRSPGPSPWRGTATSLRAGRHCPGRWPSRPGCSGYRGRRGYTSANPSRPPVREPRPGRGRPRGRGPTSYREGGPVMVGSTGDRGASPREGTPAGREGKVAGNGDSVPCPRSRYPAIPRPEVAYCSIVLFQWYNRGEGCQVPGANSGTTEGQGTVREGPRDSPGVRPLVARGFQPWDTGGAALPRIGPSYREGECGRLPRWVLPIMPPGRPSHARHAHRPCASRRPFAGR